MKDPTEDRKHVSREEWVTKNKECLNRLREIKTEHSTLSGEVESSKEMIESMERDIIVCNTNIRKVVSEKRKLEQARKTEQDSDTLVQELHGQLNQKLETLASRQLPLVAATRQIQHSEPQVSQALFINTVKLVLIGKDPPHLKVAVCITPETTFADLRDYASKYWSAIDTDNYVMCGPNYAVIEHFGKLNVWKLLEEHKMRPSVLFVDKSTLIEREHEDDFFVDEETKSIIGARNDQGQSGNLSLAQKIENFTRFRKRYAGLSAFMPEECTIATDTELKRISTWRTHICTVTAVVVLIVLSLVTGAELIDTEEAYLISYQIRGSLQREDSSGFSYDSIENFNDLQQYLTSTLPDFFFDSGDHSSVISQYKVVGPVRFLTARTKEIECELGIFDHLEGATCYDSEYTDSSKFTEDLHDDSWGQYFEPEDVDTTVRTKQIRGEFSTYDGSGYVRDFNLNELTHAGFSRNVDSLFEEGWFANDVRALIVTSAMYSYNSDYWVWLEILIENSVTGQFRPYNIVVRTFRPSLMQTHPGIITCLVFQFLLLAYFLVMPGILAYKETGSLWARGWKWLTEVWFDLGLLGLMLAEVGMVMELSLDEKDLITQDEYYDFQYSALSFRTLYIVNSWVCFMLILKLLQCLKIIRRLYLLLLSIEIAAMNLIKYAVLLLPPLIGFCCVSLSVWGPYYTNYRTFTYAVLSNLLFTIGVTEPSVLSKVNLFWTIAYFLIFLSFVVFFIMAVFIGTFMDAYRQMRVLEGYRDELPEVNYVTWLTGFVPPKAKRWIINIFSKED